MVIVDASVAAKWFFDEPLSEQAESLARTSQPVAPSFAVQELHNVLWKKLRNRTISTEAAQECAADMMLAYRKLFPIEPLAKRASRMMIDLEHPIYDCLYFALAESNKLPIITVDGGMIASAERLGSIEIIHLSDL